MLIIFLFSIGLLISIMVFAAPGVVTKDVALLESKIVALQNQINAIVTPQVFKIGDQHEGGIVFYVTKDGQHGLIAALSDQSTSAPWAPYDGCHLCTGAMGHGIGAGAMNTAMIVAINSYIAPSDEFAAKLAAGYAVSEDGITPCTVSTVKTCYGDWYLPSKEELHLMYTNLHLNKLGSFADEPYWSSTLDETGNGFQWAINFANGIAINNDQFFEKQRVRAIRAFY